jgi:hypothetical protein
VIEQIVQRGVPGVIPEIVLHGLASRSASSQWQSRVERTIDNIPEASYWPDGSIVGRDSALDAVIRIVSFQPTVLRWQGLCYEDRSI